MLLSLSLSASAALAQDPKAPNLTSRWTRRLGHDYEIACAQLCGLGHYRMRGFVTIQSAEEFQKWMEAEGEKLKGESDIFR